VIDVAVARAGGDRWEHPLDRVSLPGVNTGNPQKVFAEAARRHSVRPGASTPRTRGMLRRDCVGRVPLASGAPANVRGAQEKAVTETRSGFGGLGCRPHGSAVLSNHRQAVTESIHTRKEVFCIGYSTDLQHH
jgi:hypothetical protein